MTPIGSLIVPLIRPFIDVIKIYFHFYCRIKYPDHPPEGEEKEKEGGVTDKRVDTESPLRTRRWFCSRLTNYFQDKFP